MKIDIGPEGKILGTKKVSPNGQVSGLTEYSGQEVLIILPQGQPKVRFDAKDYAAELEKAVQEHMKLAFKEYRTLKDKFATPTEASKRYLKDVAPSSFHGLIDNVDRWAKEQVDRAEKRVEKALS
jgi:hypothetical protein